MRTFKALVVVLLFVSNHVYADSFDDLMTYFKAANVKEAVKQFNQSLEINLDGAEGVYSKQQAEVLLRNFFNSNPPKTIAIVHRGASAQGAKYAIADYVTEHKKFRLYVFMKTSQNQSLVHELRIEKE